MKFRPELFSPYPVKTIDTIMKITNVSTSTLRRLKRLKPKKVLIEKHGLIAKHHAFKKPVIQVRSVLVRRLIKGCYNRVIKLAHHVPDKGRHHMFLMPLSSRFISYLLYRRIKRNQLLQVLPHYVDTSLLFCNHLIVPAIPDIYAVYVRLVPEKPNCAVLIIVNALPTWNVLKIYHLDHPNAKRTKPRFDVIAMPPLSMFVFVHFFRKDDEIVQFHVTLYKARKERKRKLCEIRKRVLEQLRLVLSQIEILP